MLERSCCGGGAANAYFRLLALFLFGALSVYAFQYNPALSCGQSGTAVVNGTNTASLTYCYCDSSCTLLGDCKCVAEGKRGEGALALQKQRLITSQVASGKTSSTDGFICAGQAARTTHPVLKTHVAAAAEGAMVIAAATSLHSLWEKPAQTIRAHAQHHR